MHFTQYYLECLSHASYLIGDKNTGQAVIVDPRRDIEDYLSDLKEHNLTLTGVINTHFHADFVAGHLELQEQTGAWIGLGAAGSAEYDVRALTDGQRISLGDVTLEIMATPGHTPESISVLVYEHADDNTAYGVLTGDALFIGDVGRPDLLASVGVTQEELGAMLYDSIHNKLMALDDAVRVFPAHGAGSACGKNLSTERQSTVGAQRRDNYACQPMSQDEFLKLVVTGQPSAPEYFVNSVGLNKSSHPTRSLEALAKALTAGDVDLALASGAVIVDTRSPEDFASKHIVGSHNVGIAGRFAETAGMFVSADDSIVIVADIGEEQHAATRLSRIGLDKVVGYVADLTEYFNTHTDQVASAQRITAEEFNATNYPESTQIVDLRNTGELDVGMVEGAIHLPLAELKRRVGELDRAQPVVAYCAGGWRSSVGSSYLRAAGFTEVTDVIGGYGAINPAGVCPSTLAAK